MTDKRTFRQARRGSHRLNGLALLGTALGPPALADAPLVFFKGSYGALSDASDG